jgi:hypothetical protein
VPAKPWLWPFQSKYIKPILSVHDAQMAKKKIVQAELFFFVAFSV